MQTHSHKNFPKYYVIDAKAQGIIIEILARKSLEQSQESEKVKSQLEEQIVEQGQEIAAAQGQLAQQDEQLKAMKKHLYKLDAMVVAQIGAKPLAMNGGAAAITAASLEGSGAAAASSGQGGASSAAGSTVSSYSESTESPQP